MRNVLVAGIGSTTFGRHTEVDIQVLASRAADAAIRDSGLSRDAVGALYLGNFISGPLTGQEVLAGLVADSLGLPQIPCSKMEGACASGGIAFRHAYLAVASGTCDVALAVGVEKLAGLTGRRVLFVLDEETRQKPIILSAKQAGVEVWTPLDL